MGGTRAARSSPELRREVGGAALRMVAIVLGGIALYSAAPLSYEYWVMELVTGVVIVVACVVATVRRTRVVQAAERPLLAALEALVLVMTLLIFGFAALHFVLADGGQFQGLETKLDAVYFTVVTIGTVGYGDISPSGQGARLAVTVQILFTLTFIGAALRVLTRLGTRKLDAPR